MEFYLVDLGSSPNLKIKWHAKFNYQYTTRGKLEGNQNICIQILQISTAAKSKDFTIDLQVVATHKVHLI